MSKSKLILLVLVVSSLACSLTSPPENRAEEISIQAQPTAQIADELIMPTSTPITCIVTATVLQLRECAGMSCIVKNWLDHGDVLSVQQKKNGWYQVTTPTDESGWINSKYCGGM